MPRLNSRGFFIMIDKDFFYKVLHDAKVEAEKEANHKKMKAFETVLSERERVMFVYVPIVLTQVVFRYIEIINDYCARKCLPFKNETRELKRLIKQYTFSNFSGLSSDCTNSLDRQVNDFFYDAGDDVQTLYFVINSELKKVYPELDDYELLTYLYMSISLLDYTHHYIRKTNKLITEKTNYVLVSYDVYSETYKMRGVLKDMTRLYNIQSTQMIELAIKIIGNKVDNAVMEIIS